MTGTFLRLIVDGCNGPLSILHGKNTSSSNSTSTPSTTRRSPHGQLNHSTATSTAAANTTPCQNNQYEPCTIDTTAGEDNCTTAAVTSPPMSIHFLHFDPSSSNKKNKKVGSHHAGTHSHSNSNSNSSTSRETMNLLDKLHALVLEQQEEQEAVHTPPPPPPTVAEPTSELSQRRQRLQGLFDSILIYFDGKGMQSNKLYTTHSQHFHVTPRIEIRVTDAKEQVDDVIVHLLLQDSSSSSSSSLPLPLPLPLENVQKGNDSDCVKEKLQDVVHDLQRWMQVQHDNHNHNHNHNSNSNNSSGENIKPLDPVQVPHGKRTLVVYTLFRNDQGAGRQRNALKPLCLMRPFSPYCFFVVACCSDRHCGCDGGGRCGGDDEIGMKLLVKSQWSIMKRIMASNMYKLFGNVNVHKCDLGTMPKIRNGQAGMNGRRHARSDSGRMDGIEDNDEIMATTRTIVVTEDVFLRQRVVAAGGFVMTFEQLWKLLEGFHDSKALESVLLQEEQGNRIQEQQNEKNAS